MYGLDFFFRFLIGDFKEHNKRCMITIGITRPRDYNAWVQSHYYDHVFLTKYQKEMKQKR